MQWCSWLQVQSPGYITSIAFIWRKHSCYPTPNKHQTQRAFIPHTSEFRHTLMISNFKAADWSQHADWISHLALPLVVVSEAHGCWLQFLKCCCQFGFWILTAVDVLLQWGLLLSCLPPAPPPWPGLTWCKRGHVGPRLQRLHLSGQGRHSVLSLLQHIVPTQASHHAGQAS